MTQTWGLANGNVGWANEPLDYIIALSALESEKNLIEKAEFEIKKNTKPVNTKAGE